MSDETSPPLISDKAQHLTDDKELRRFEAELLQSVREMRNRQFVRAVKVEVPKDDGPELAVSEVASGCGSNRWT